MYINIRVYVGFWMISYRTCFQSSAVMNACDTVSANCRKSLGMHSGAIPDSAITASSSYDSASVGPSNARCAAVSCE